MGPVPLGQLELRDRSRQAIGELGHVFDRQPRGIGGFLRRDGTAGVPMTNFSDHDATASEKHRVLEWREIGLGAQILRDLGVASIRNLATSPRSYVGLSGFGIDLAGEESIES